MNVDISYACGMRATVEDTTVGQRCLGFDAAGDGVILLFEEGSACDDE